jgi:hypothetical protein
LGASPLGQGADMDEDDRKPVAAIDGGAVGVA